MTSHPKITRLLILNLQNKHSNFAGMNFEMSVGAVSEATDIPLVGEKWFKKGKLDKYFFDPFIKTRYRGGSKTIFPFSHLKHRYASLMLVIMKYFTCEGRYSRLYTYHVRLLMHFTGAKVLNLPYYLYRSIEKMSSIFQRRNHPQKMHSLFHHSLIKMVVLHQLEQQGIPWDVFITHEVFTNPQPPHQPNLPSSSAQVPSPQANLPSSPSLGASSEAESGNEESHED